MKEKHWKTLAIIFMVLFLLENLFFGWSLYLVNQEEKNINDCYYNTCNEYPEATFEENVCTCYDYDLMGSLIVAKTEYKQ